MSAPDLFAVNPALERVVDAARRRGLRVVGGPERFTIECPVHDGFSLRVAAGRARPVVMRCMGASCDPRDIVAALGLSMRDLMGES